MRRLQIKFPSQIRISGWDFGSSARAMNQAGGKDALMTYENESAQAELGKGLNSTTERKSMSTKTTIKRIALVAVSALGLGVLTSVAPASAASAVPTSITVGTSEAARVGVAANTSITFALPSGFVGGTDTFTVSALVTAAPAGSAFNTVQASGGGNSVTDAAGKVASGNSIAGKLSFAASSILATSGTAAGTASSGNAQSTANYGAATALVTGATSSATTASIKVVLTPDVAGTYTILVGTSLRALAAGEFQTGDNSATFTITTAGAPTSLAVSTTGSVVNGASNGAVLSVTMKDAAGNATRLGLNETLNITKTTGSDITIGGAASSNALGSSSTLSSGNAYRVTAIDGGTVAKGSDVITFTGAGLLPSTLVITATVTTVAATALASGDVAFDLDDATYYSGTSTPYKSAGSSHTLTGTFAAAATADTVYAVDVAITNGLSYATSFTVIKGDKTGSVTVSAALNTTNSSVVVTAGDAITINYEAAKAAKIALVGTNTATSATGGKTTWTVKATNQYAGAIAYVPVAVTVSGRNTVASTALGVTDANGFISYTLTDAGTSGTKDTITFSTTASGVTDTPVAYVNYGTVTVGTVTVKGGNNTTTGVAATTAQWKDINAGVSGASATTHDVIATVKDASGNLVAGVPVTFSVSGTGAAITSTTSTVLTSSDGTATAKVYAWIAGKYTVTATAGGKTGTADYQFRQSAAGEERTISATVSGNLVTAKVVDRFGNPVPAVTVWGTITGGYFGTGTLKTDSTTDNDGVVSFIVNGGASTVTLATYNAATATAPYGSGQTCARAGASDCNVDAADDTAFTASVAGTTTVAEKGVGASFAPAGVASVSVDVNASSASDSVDAANEATDAANAATDAANAAAEAADAATAAAQDAQAAVAALATQVASLIAGIKAQITTLTNLVIKIQKKVRA